ncbi:MAG: glycosyltransferase family 4 protein [Methanomassiliicoccus sp.]|nr:MAG: glycosyltransferase family 4 protein [Methanomassiliicoccus sp.]
MKILLIGGDFREGCQITGYVNALREIASELANKNDVHVIPFLPERPQLEKDSDWKGVHVVSRWPSLAVTFKTIRGWPSAHRRVHEYLHGYDEKGLVSRVKAKVKYSVVYSFNKSFFERKLKELQPDVVHVHGLIIQMLPFIDVLLERGTPFVITAHGLYTHDANVFLDFDKGLEGDMMKEIDRRGCPITVVSQGVKDKALSLFSLNPDNVHVVHNGVDTTRFEVNDKTELRRKHGLPLDKVILLSVGTVGKRKNQRATLEALKEMGPEERERVMFLVVGGGETKELQATVKKMGLEGNVRITGKVPDDALVEMYLLADLFVLTSTSEGFPLVYLEAMAAGLPIVTYADIESVSELFDLDCMVLADRAAEDLCATLVNAIERSWDHDLIRRKATAWDWDEVCSQYEHVYEIVL